MGTQGTWESIVATSHMGLQTKKTKLKAAGGLADSSEMRSTVDPNDPNFTASAVRLPPCERRREDRVKIGIPVRIISQGFGGEVSQDGMCTDISEAGIGFETNVDLYVGETVDVQFRQKDAGVFRFQVRLLYKIKNRYGASFGP